jgi:hypothetical protein
MGKQNQQDPPLAAEPRTSLVLTVAFDGTPGHYNRLPRVLADDSIPSRLDGNDTKLIVNRVGGGNLVTGAATLGTLFAVIYDDAENTSAPASPANATSSFRSEPTTFRVSLAAGMLSFGRTHRVDEVLVDDDFAILGSAINFNAGAGHIHGGHNLHKLTLTAAGTLVIPIFPASCEDVQTHG